MVDGFGLEKLSSDPLFEFVSFSIRIPLCNHAQLLLTRDPAFFKLAYELKGIFLDLDELFYSIGPAFNGLTTQERIKLGRRKVLKRVPFEDRRVRVQEKALRGPVALFEDRNGVFALVSLVDRH